MLADDTTVSSIVNSISTAAKSGVGDTVTALIPVVILVVMVNFAIRKFKQYVK